jgi:hypothetical protein
VEQENLKQKKPRQWRGYTGFCCCRESGLGACVSLWWFLIVIRMPLLLLVVGFYFLLWASSGFDVWLQMSSFTGVRNRDLSCAGYTAASPVPWSENLLFLSRLDGITGLEWHGASGNRKKFRRAIGRRVLVSS